MKKLFCILFLILIVSLSALTCFASDSISSIQDNTYYYSSLPLSFKCDHNNLLSYTASTEISINNLGSTYYNASGYPTTDLTFDEYYYQSSSLVKSSGYNGYFTDYIFEPSGYIDNFRLSSSSFIFDINDTSQPRLRLCVSEAEEPQLWYTTHQLNYSLNILCIDLYDANNGIVSVPINGTFEWDANFDKWHYITIRGEQYYACYLNIFDILDSAIEQIADNDQYDYAFGSLVQVIDFNLSDINPIPPLGLQYKFILRYYDSTASTIDKQVEYSTFIQNRLYDLSVSQELDFSFRDFFFTTVGGWFDFQIIPGISIGAIFAFFIGLALLLAFLKAFAGG